MPCHELLKCNTGCFKKWNHTALKLGLFETPCIFSEVWSGRWVLMAHLGLETSRDLATQGKLSHGRCSHQAHVLDSTWYRMRDCSTYFFITSHLLICWVTPRGLDMSVCTQLFLAIEFFHHQTPQFSQSWYEEQYRFTGGEAWLAPAFIYLFRGFFWSFLCSGIRSFAYFGNWARGWFAEPKRRLEAPAPDCLCLAKFPSLCCKVNGHFANDEHFANGAGSFSNSSVCSEKPSQEYFHGRGQLRLWNRAEMTFSV